MSYNQFRSDKTNIEYENYLEKCEDRWSVESNNYYVSTSFGKTFVRQYGNGEPLVLLPGTMSSSLQYAKQIEQFATKYIVFAIDTIGDFGKSYLSKKIESTDDYVQWQKELYDHLNFDGDISIMGVSMGAWLGALYSSKYSNVSKLILISPVAVVANISLKSTLLGITPMLFPFLSKFCMKKYFTDFLDTSEDADNIFEEKIFESIMISKKCFKPVAPQIPKQFCRSEIDSIQCRVLYFVGENELMYNAKKGLEYFNSEFKNGVGECIKDAGHDLMEIRPEYIADKVMSF